MRGEKTLHLGKAPEFIREISLDGQENFSEFEYSALNFTKAEKNQYKYILEGLDKEWFSAGNRRFGRYSGLDGGDYTLRIIGSNNDGVWNEEGVSIAIHVASPFWKTGWFYALVGVCVAGVAGVFYVQQMSRLKAQNQAKLLGKEMELRGRFQLLR